MLIDVGVTRSENSTLLCFSCRAPSKIAARSYRATLCNLDERMNLRPLAYLGVCFAILGAAPAAHAESATDVSPICTTVFQETGPRTLLGRGAYCHRSDVIERELVSEDKTRRARAEIHAYAYSDNPTNKPSWDVKFRFRTKLVSGDWEGMQIKPAIDCGGKCTVAPHAGVALVPGGLSEELVVTMNPDLSIDNPLVIRPSVEYKIARSGDSFDDGPSLTSHTGMGYVPQLRCDSGLARANSKGCVYPDAPAVLRSIKTTDPRVRESAEHIREAQASGLPGKYVAKGDGSILADTWAAKPLKRTRNALKITANRQAAVKMCKEKYQEELACGTSSDADTPLPGCSCDEYPFASTQTRDELGDAFSTKRITASDNSLAGTMLGNFYTSARVLDEEDFYVSIDE